MRIAALLLIFIFLVASCSGPAQVQDNTAGNAAGKDVSEPKALEKTADATDNIDVLSADDVDLGELY